MRFVPDFGKLLYGILVYLMTWGIIWFIRYIDEEVRACDREYLNKLVFRISAGSSLMMIIIQYLVKFSVLESISILLLGSYLATAAIMDILLYQINDFLQFIGLFGGCLWLINRELDIRIGISLICFSMLQYFLFMRMYGRADGMAFCICTLYWAGLGFDIEMSLYHMGLCVVLLAVVQAACGNISKKGNLKRPTAMYPYIAGSFWVLFMQIIH